DLVLECRLDLRRLLLRGSWRIIEPLHVVAVDAVDREVVTEAFDFDRLSHQRPGLRAVLREVEVVVALVEPRTPTPDGTNADQSPVVIEVRQDDRIRRQRLIR